MIFPWKHTALHNTQLDNKMSLDGTQVPTSTCNQSHITDSQTMLICLVSVLLAKLSHDTVVEYVQRGLEQVCINCRVGLQFCAQGNRTDG